MKLGGLFQAMVGCAVGAIFLLSSAASSFFWPLFSARLLISYPTERPLYLLSLVGALAAVPIIHQLWQGSALSGRGVVLGLSLFLATLCWVVVCWSWRDSNALFFYWKTKTETRESWNMVADELDKLVKRTTQPDSLVRGDMPPSFAAVLGTAFYYGNVSRLSDGSAQAKVVYGYKSRCWGLFQGEDPNYPMELRINDRTWFFVTTN